MNPERTPLCPHCELPLKHGVRMEAGTGKAIHTVYCARGGSNASVAANNGAEGSTLEEAMEKLEQLIDAEDCEKDAGAKQ